MMGPKSNGKKRPATYGKQPTKRQAQARRVHLLDDDDSHLDTSIPHFDATSPSLLPTMSWVPDTFQNPPPTSQKAATIMTEPSSAAIAEVQEFTSVPYETARRYLKVKHNDTLAAVNAILEQESLEGLEKAESWDESAWETDRDGNKQLVSLGASAAPTRGPSPAPSLGLKNPKTQADEEDDFQRALLLSQQNDGGEAAATSFSQETGIRAADGTESSKYFGPATKDHYEEQKWALTHVAQEVIPDVPARERKHVQYEPRILKHLPDRDYTPNLLSICSAIPKAKEALLMRPSAKDDYQYEADWWRGQSIAMPRIVHTTDGSLANPDNDKYDEFTTEVQRLMAALNSSDRSYITIGALTQVELIRDTDLSSGPGSLLELFLHSWATSATRMNNHPNANEQISGMFNTIVGTNAEEGMSTPNLTVYDMAVKGSAGQKTELYELMDNLLWDTSDDSDTTDNFIERPADVLVMRLSQSDSSATQLGVEVPAALTLDKYAKEHVAASRAVRQRMAQGRKRVAKIEQIEKKLKDWQHPTKSTQIDAQQLLKHTLGHFSGQNRRDTDKADTTNNASLANHEQPGYAEIAAKLEAVIASVDEKLKLLTEEKEKVRKAISEMSKAPLPGLDESSPEHHYTLRGVATKPNITYILQKKNPNDGAAPSQDDEATPHGYEWWRVDYEVSGQSAKITTTRAADYDVLRAVELEHSSALLVYASDEACSLEDYGHEGLPDGLAKFVERDNLQLQKEIDSADEEVAPPAYDFSLNDIPRNSIERRGSMDSMGGNVDMADVDERQHPGYGLGYDVQVKSDGVHELRLSPPTTTSLREVEMTQKANTPLLAQYSDVDMGGMESQDRGGGDAMHVEDREAE